MRILLMIPTLGSGGAERVITSLAEGLTRNGHAVSLLTLSTPDTDFFSVPPGVSRIALGVMGHSRGWLSALLANVRRMLALRRAVALAKPDVVLSFMTSMNVLAVLACAGLGVRLVASERVDPSSYSYGLIWSRLRLLTYRRLDALVVQTGQAERWFRERLPSRLAITTIANPLSIQPASAGSEVQVPKPFLLAAGRLVPQKGFDLLIRAFATMARNVEPLHLAIAGEGPDEQALRALAADLGISARVQLLGRVRGLSALMNDATAFVLSSRFEGFPNVLLEALGNGVPSISTDCPGGSREILRDGACGLLVPSQNVDALAAAMSRLTTDVSLQRELAQAGRAAADDYRLEKIVAQWERVLAPTAALRRG